MLNSVQEHPPSSDKSPLAQWIHQTIGRNGLRVQFRLRGNNLLVLCEGNPAPNRGVILNRLVPALHQTDINTLLPTDQPLLYHVLLYGRTLGQEQPLWSARLYLNQISRHLEQLRQMQTSARRSATSGGVAQRSGTEASLTATRSPQAASVDSALVLSNRSQAKRGHPEAIARYLSETISRLGIAVKVNVKTIPYPSRSATPNLLNTHTVNASATRRLWIVCEAMYSPDPLLIGEPVAQRLRDLELEGFRDAVILIQVTGEPEPDWSLRVDLTPATEMLRDLARWGDIGAIACLVKQTLADLEIQLSDSILKESTLHLSCSKRTNPSSLSSPSIADDQAAVHAAIAPLLESLGPQGIHAAAIYGQITEQDAPAWVDWLTLPAAQHPALAEPPLTLAQNGDWDAIAFLLNRLLNPDLDKQLATGGIRVQLLLKQDLLQVMTDAPLCPDQRRVSSTVIKLLKQLKLPGVAGVRIYGRRAGQKRPLWSYGSDFTPRQRIVPEAMPEFAATDVYIGDLVAHPGDQVVRPDLTPEDLQNAWARFKQKATQTIQHGLIRSQLFVPAIETKDLSSKQFGQAEQSGTKVVLIWGAIGLLLTIQVDWLLNRVLHSVSNQPVVEAPPLVITTPLPAPSAPSPATLPTPKAEPSATASSSSKTSEETKPPSIFNPAGFIQASPNVRESAEPTAPANSSPSASPVAPSPEATPPPQTPRVVVSSADSPFPTFNSRQLDEKMALYYRRLEESGVPDVLVIGSSRALRGVDPAALERELARLGYADVSVFNFGVNGATAQVVDLIVRRMLTPEQLPRLIVWADGARAFNSGNVDVTYNGIVVSEGYRELSQGTLSIPRTSQVGDSAATAERLNPASGLGASLAASYQGIDRWLSDRLAQLSGTYEERDRLKSLLQSGLTALLPTTPAQSEVVITLPTQEGVTAVSPQSRSLENQGLVDLDGFLPLSVRFNPATYYQKYARVSGQYDSDYEDFQVQGKQDDALRSLLQFTRSSDIPVVFINLPLTDDYLDTLRQQYEQEFRQYMLSLAVGQQGLIFRDLGELWPDRYDYFSDPSHLNRYGALEVSKHIAEDPMIPWFKPARDTTP